jgi:hypothetical protein
MLPSKIQLLLAFVDLLRAAVDVLDLLFRHFPINIY